MDHDTWGCIQHNYISNNQSCNAMLFQHQIQNKLQVHASKQGLGEALIQTDLSQSGKERIAVFAWKSLSEVEKRYANIEY